MASIAKLFKVNKLGPIGLLASVACFAGIILPWKQTQHGVINGTWDPIGWIMVILILLYVLLLFANFKWNILLGFALLILSVYKWIMIKGELSAESATDAQTAMGYGLYVIMISALVMMLSKLLLFRKRKYNQEDQNTFTSTSL